MNLTALKSGPEAVRNATPNSRPLRFSATQDPPQPKTPTLLELLDRNLVKLAVTDPAQAKTLKTQRDEFFGTFQDYSSVLMVFIQFKIAINKFNLPLPKFLKDKIQSIPINRALKEFHQVGFEEDKLRAVLTKFDKMNGDEKFKELIKYCDGLAKQNFREFLTVPVKA